MAHPRWGWRTETSFRHRISSKKYQNKKFLRFAWKCATKFEKIYLKVKEVKIKLFQNSRGLFNSRYNPLIQKIIEIRSVKVEKRKNIILWKRHLMFEKFFSLNVLYVFQVFILFFVNQHTNDWLNQFTYKDYCANENVAWTAFFTIFWKLYLSR